MFQVFFGSIFFEFIGALTRWLFLAIYYSLKGKKIKSFKEVWSGDPKAHQREQISYGFSNIMLGMIVVFLFFLFILWIEGITFPV